jgi:phage protein D
MTTAQLTPGYRLTLGERVIDTATDPAASPVLDLSVSLDLDTPVDACAVVLARDAVDPPARGDPAAVELGYSGGGLTRVLTGAVATVDVGLTTTRVVLHSAGAALLRTRLDRTFDTATAGAIVRELAKASSVRVARADAGSTFPAYVVDGRRGAFDHLRDLADLCGFDVYVDPDGAIVFQRFDQGRTVHLFSRGQDVLGVDALTLRPAADAVEAWGESPGTGRGENAWAWLVKDFRPSLGTGGTTGVAVLLERPSLRTAVAARTAAEAAAAAYRRRAQRGRLSCLGRPAVLLGDALRLRDVPDVDGTALWQVVAVRHRLSRRHGFTTAVDFRAVA